MDIFKIREKVRAGDYKPSASYPTADSEIIGYQLIAQKMPPLAFRTQYPQWAQAIAIHEAEVTEYRKASDIKYDGFKADLREAVQVELGRKIKDETWYVYWGRAWDSCSGKTQEDIIEKMGDVLDVAKATMNEVREG